MSAPRRSALHNAGFRRLLLVIAGVPLAAQYLVQTVVVPIAGRGFDPTDFKVYLKAAQALAAGRDPYATFFSAPVRDATLNQGYIYPPALAWLMRPLAGVPEHTAIVVGILVAQACLLASLVILLRAIGVRDRERTAWLVLAALLFYPVWLNLDMIQLNLVLLLAGSIWFAAWLRGDRWWGGAALGLGLALKALQGPWLLLTVWGRRWRMLVAAAAAGAGLWAIGDPGRLVEYWTRVFPQLGAGSGFRENLTPGGLVAQVLDPPSFYAGQIAAAQTAVHAVSVLVALGALAATWWALSARPAAGRDRRALEAAAAVAVTPIASTLAWPSHLVFLVIPMLVLASRALTRGDLRLGAGLGATWLLLGPAHTGMLAAIANRFTVDWALRFWAATGVAAMILVWLLCMAELRGSARAQDAEDRPGQVAEHDQAAAQAAEAAPAG